MGEFSMKTTKNAITHLKAKHNIAPAGLIVARTTPAQQTIRAAFGPSMPRITFKEDICTEILLLWTSTPTLASVCVSNQAFELYAHSWTHTSKTILSG